MHCIFVVERNSYSWNWTRHWLPAWAD